MVTDGENMKLIKIEIVMENCFEAKDFAKRLQLACTDDGITKSVIVNEFESIEDEKHD